VIAPAPQGRPRAGTSRAVALLAGAAVVVVTTEFVVVGLLPAMGRDLAISLDRAGRLVTWFALSAAVLGPVLTIAASRWAPHRVLAAALAPFAIGNLVTAVASSYWLLAAIRMVEGAVLPAFVSVGNAAVAELAGRGREGRAIAAANLGVIAGIVLTVPAGVALAEHTGWRAIFVGLAALTGIAALAVYVAFPRSIRDVRRRDGARERDGDGGAASPRAQVAILWQPRFLAHLLLSAVLFTAMFAGYTYLTAFLEEVAGLRGARLAAVLVGFGLVGLFGNWIAGRVVDRRPTGATAGAAFALLLATAAVSAIGAGRDLAILFPLLGLWGAAHAAAFVLCQVRVMLAGPSAPAFASSLNIAACNLGIAAGALVGGAIVQHVGVAAIGYGSAALAAVALAIAAHMAPG